MYTRFELESVGIALAGALALGVVSLLNGASADLNLPVNHGEAEPSTASTTLALELRRRVEFQEPDTALVGDLTRLERGPRGRFALVDRTSGRVSIYDSSGALADVVGRPGEGPGEFLRPVDAAFLDDGTLAIVETGQPRLTRYDMATGRTYSFRLKDAYYGVAVGETTRGLAVYVNGTDRRSPQLHIYDRQGELVDRLHTMQSEYRQVPYWSAMTKRLMAIKRDNQIVAGANLTLPFVLYGSDGSVIDSLVPALPGWHAVPRPARGQFTGGDARRRFETWRRTFPTIDAIEIYRDSLLLVATEELDETVLSTEIGTYDLHVFDLATGSYLGGVPLPGRLLDAAEQIYCLTEEPPTGWIVSEYDLRLE